LVLIYEHRSRRRVQVWKEDRYPDQQRKGDREGTDSEPFPPLPNRPQMLGTGFFRLVHNHPVLFIPPKRQQ
jgi:hypothetical protein